MTQHRGRLQAGGIVDRGAPLTFTLDGNTTTRGAWTDFTTTG